MSELQPPRVELREEGMPSRSVLLVRFHVQDMNNVIKASLSNWTSYKPIAAALGLTAEGALTLSSFALHKGWRLSDMSQLCAHSHYLSAPVGRLQDAKVDVWPTNFFDVYGQPDPRNEVHWDIVVPDVPGVVPSQVSQGTPAQRRAARTSLLPNFEKILSLMDDPRAL